MIIKKDMSLGSFGFWSGAKNNANMLTDEQLTAVEEALEEFYPDGIDETTLNDLFWFEFEYICELIGLEYDAENDKIIE